MGLGRAVAGQEPAWLEDSVQDKVPPFVSPPRTIAIERARRGPAWYLRLTFAMCTIACLLALTGCSGSESAKKSATPAPTVTGVRPATATKTATPTIVQASPTAVPSVTPERPTPVEPDSADIAEGMVLVQAQCAWCHTLASAGLTGSQASVGPPLDGAGVGHNRAWLSAALVDACAHHKPKSRYSCAQKHNTVAALTVEQRDQIVRFLLTLKGTPTPTH
jgi:mono/diheme cytochrome c family protein